MTNDRYVPINKGNYSMDTDEREAKFEANRGDGWEQEYAEYRNNWSEFPQQQHVSDYPLLVDIEVPTVVIVGRQDLTTPLVRAEEMAADISTSRLVILEECGHMAPLEKPAEVTAALRKWLDA